MSNKVVVKEREVRLARAFLKAINGDQANGYLLLAIIAWGRAQAKAHDPFWKSLSHYGAATAGAKLAAHLRAKMRAHPSDYRGLAAVLKRRPGAASGQQEQAESFLLIIEKSHYDAKHYGYVQGTEGRWVWVPPQGDRNKYDEPIPGYYAWHPGVQEQDPLHDAWASLTGHPIPPAWFNDPKQTTVQKRVETVVRPSQPRSLQHVLPHPDYILPYAALHFYMERPHVGDFVLPQD